MRIQVKCEHSTRAVTIDREEAAELRIERLVRGVLLACPACRREAERWLEAEVLDS